jgi:hypothetical protein
MPKMMSCLRERIGHVHQFVDGHALQLVEVHRFARIRQFLGADDFGVFA